MVSALAAELRLELRDLLKSLRVLGIQAKSASSMVGEEDAKKVRGLLTKHTTTTPAETSKTDVKDADKPAAPKIIIKINNDITVKDLADELKVKVGEVIKELMRLKILATINQRIDFNIANEVAKVFGAEVHSEAAVEVKHAATHQKDDAIHLKTRPPIVVVMGHVDHGKTKLLDAIRKTNVIDTEAGGITQHIGAYQVDVKGRKVTFLDTPGHEAFTALRSRGARVTDIAILVVAADDGMMPQTIEAMDHAKAAGVPIIVAINKIDKPEANVERVKKQLMDHDLTPEEWGGKTVTVLVSAKQNKGIDELLEMVLLVADMHELKANPVRSATGIVIEAKLDKGRGPVTTVLVGNGTLKVGDCFYVGAVVGKVRAILNDKGERIEKAPPSSPVEVLGAETVPVPGDVFRVVHDDKTARKLAEKRQHELDSIKLQRGKVISLEDFSRSMKQGERKDLNIILKGDVQGSVEAIKAMLTNLSTADIRVNILHAGVGSISESDVMLALASRAIVIGFNVTFDGNAENVAEDKGIETKIYNIIYQIEDDVKLAMQGLLEPVKEEFVLGHAFVKATFKYSKVGTIAGCMVKDGKIQRGAQIRLFREGKKIFEGKLESLKRFKEDAKEVLAGFECGISIHGHNDFKENDEIECFEIRTTLRKL
jgi:translation initiation factor IF-2